MKISPEDFQTLQTLIKKHVTKEMLAQHREGLKQRKDCKDREMRLRWDALWYSEKKDREAFRDWFDHAYTYLNDDHINTALKQIIAEIEGGEEND